MRELPTGTVTFLFTDIEGSTRLLQKVGGQFADILKDHSRIMRAAISAASGVEVGTAGDSFFAAFREPVDGIRAAVRAQRDLAAHPSLHGGTTFPPNLRRSSAGRRRSRRWNGS